MDIILGALGYTRTGLYTTGKITEDVKKVLKQIKPSFKNIEYLILGSLWCTMAPKYCSASISGTSHSDDHTSKRSKFYSQL